VEELSSGSIASCILELRDRITALEASAGIGQSTTPANTSAPADSPIKVRRQPLQCPSPATIAECGGPCEAGFMHCDCGLLEQLNPPLRPTPAPADSLVVRVAKEIAEQSLREGDPSWAYLRPEARAAIREVAAWLDTKGQHGCSLWMREEAER
jgi:hypothetical protein